VLNDEELISAIFYLAGGRVRGSTRLQKVVFLVERVLGLGGLRFEPWRYGPWSRELEELLKELEGRGLLKVRAERRVPSEGVRGVPGPGQERRGGV
jgi:uncharacterized protein YwgA